MDIRARTSVQRQRYRADWIPVQAAFVDHPARAGRDADHLIMEVLHPRSDPISDFEQRPAEIPIQHRELVSNDRAARRTADKKGQHNVDP